MENAYFIVKDKVGIFLYFLFKRDIDKNTYTLG